ncbi:MAG: hypothetical protein AAFY71_07395 [Bacteroidota bacterium]
MTYSEFHLKRWVLVPIFSLIFLTFLGQNGLIAQEIPARKASFGRFVVHAGLGNQTIGFPFQNLGQSFNPGLADLGIDWRINKGLKHQFLLGITSSYFVNEHTGNTFLLAGKFSYRWQFLENVHASLGLLMGNISQSYPRNTWVYHDATESYEKGNSSIQAGASGFELGVGYSLPGGRYAIRLSKQFLFQSPYFPSKAFNVLPQNHTSLGLFIHLHPIKKS